LDFKADKSVTAAPSQTPSGIEVAFDIAFEPSNLGETKSTLILSSPIGGDYVFPLFGSCQAPKPQGPFVIKANGNTSISFKNVFSAQLQFTFAIDNPLFYVTKSSDTIKAHQSYKIIVGFDGNDSANKADVMGKLIVSPPKLAGLSSNVQWIYYLKGVTA
jgi:hydrocephalus-inducing protein